MVDHAVQQEVSAIRAVNAQHRIYGLEPFLSLLRIDIVEAIEFGHWTSGDSGLIPGVLSGSAGTAHRPRRECLDFAL